MSWKKISTYFPHQPPTFLRELFKNSDLPWSPLSGLKENINHFFKDLNQAGDLKGDRKIILKSDGTLNEGSYYIKSTQVLAQNFVDPELNVFIGKGTIVEAGSTIKDNSIIEESCEIRQGAYIRGCVFVGAHSVVGHTTEIKNSIFVQHVEAGHFAYIGDSIIGSYSNLGAGTKISNLQFRTLKDKVEENFPEIPLVVEGKLFRTGIAKFGAIIGDGGETGCNSVLSPFVLLGPECWIVPNLCVTKGIYPRKSILKSTEDCRSKKL